jgi:AcrR family transcriptional regulator
MFTSQEKNTELMDKMGPKDRILETAFRLFYSQGYNSTGINQILDEAKVAKASLYQHFSSKDDVGLAYLKAGREEWFQSITKWTASKKTPAQKVVACFDFLEYALQMNNFLGCKFINMLTEIGETNPSMSKEIKEHKTKLREYIKGFVTSSLDSSDAEKADTVGDAIYLLYEGAIIESKIFKNTWPVKNAKKMVKILLKYSE